MVKVACRAGHVYNSTDTAHRKLEQANIAYLGPLAISQADCAICNHKRQSTMSANDEHVAHSRHYRTFVQTVDQ